MSIRGLAREPLRNLQPYEAAAQVDDTIRLNANEAAWRNTGDNFRRALNRYPEVRPCRLRQLMADRYGCTPANLLVTRGSSEGIDLLMRVFCEAGRDNVVTAEPTFSMYAHYAIVQGAELRQVPTNPDEDFRADPARILEACAQRLEETTGYRRGDWPAAVPILFTAHSIPNRWPSGSIREGLGGGRRP